MPLSPFQFLETLSVKEKYFRNSLLIDRADRYKNQDLEEFLFYTGMWGAVLKIASCRHLKMLDDRASR